jgi:RNA polymerase sigma-70 factor (ECF subfamily)
MPERTDQELMARAQEEPAAFGVLYDRYVDRIYGYVRRSTRDDATAEDITANAFEKAWRALPTYRPERASFSAWLYRIAHNELASYWRRERFLAPWRKGFAAGGSVAAGLEARETRAELERALERLPPRDRDILRLRFYEELTSAEVATVLNCSRNSVYVRVHRALKRLERALEAVWPEE